MNVTLADIKAALNIVGTYQDAALQIYFDETKDFLVDAGVKEENITKGIMARGVSDLWNYGAGEGKFSAYFLQRASQLSFKG